MISNLWLNASLGFFARGAPTVYRAPYTLLLPMRQLKKTPAPGIVTGLTSDPVID